MGLDKEALIAIRKDLRDSLEAADEINDEKFIIYATRLIEIIESILLEIERK